MNILFFSRLFYPHIGGVEKHVYKLSELLIKQGHKVTVVTEQDSPETSLTEIFEGIKIFRIPNLKNERFKKYQIWIWLLQSVRLIKNADVVHCHDVFFWYLPFRFLFPFKKVFATFHGYESFPLKNKGILIHKISEKLSFGNICIGDFIRKWYGTKPSLVSYGGVDVNKVKSQKSKVKNPMSALFIGRLDEQTGFLTYLEAVKRVQEKFPNFKLTVFGDGKFRKNSDDNIEYKGFIQDAQREIAKYDFAFVSRYLSILEAMAAKRLVFAVYDNPLKEDYLRMAPFVNSIVICGTRAELVSKIIYHLENPKAKDEMVEKAYSWVKNNTWEAMTAVYLKLWNRGFDRKSSI